VYEPPSRLTSSISDVSDSRCCVRSGEFEGGEFSLVWRAWPFAPPLPGILGNGGSSSLSLVVVVEERRRVVRDLDLDRSEWEGGRGVMSGASSKVSWLWYLGQQALLHGFSKGRSYADRTLHASRSAVHGERGYGKASRC